MSSKRRADAASDGLDDFGAFYEATYDRAYRTALAIMGDPLVAADVTQDAFVSAYRARARYRGEGPAGHWLMRIVVRTAIDALERRRKLRTVSALPGSDQAEAGHERASVDRIVIDRALGELGPRDRAAVVLRYLVDLDYATIARILDTTPGNVGVILNRSLRQLRIELSPPEPSVARREPADG